MTLSFAERGAAPRELADDDAERSPGLRGPVDDHRRQRLRLEPRLRGGERLADHLGDLDLVRLAGRDLAPGRSPLKNSELDRVVADAVVALEHAAAVDDRDGRRVAVVGRRERLRRQPAGWASAFVMNAFQISAGNVPPATGWPWNSVVIGTSLSG